MVKGRYLIVVDHVAENRVVFVQRVVLDQIHVPVPNGDIPLGIHLAVIAQLDLIALLLGGQIDSADGIVQPILSKVLHILNDEGGGKGLELLQQLIDFFLAHREILILVIEPGFILVECQRFLVVLPGEGLH